MVAAMNKKQDSNVQPVTFGIVTKPMGGCYGQGYGNPCKM